MKRFFILGNPRSGSTMLRLLLNEHSEIAVPPESGFYHWLSNKYGDWSRDNLNDLDIDKYLFDLQNCKKFETWLLPNSAIKRTIEYREPVSYNALTDCVYLTYSRFQNKEARFLGDKNNYYINHLEDLHRLAPESYFIQIVRDGRDTVCSYRAIGQIDDSYKYKPKLPTEISEIAEQWQSNNLRIRDYFYQNDKFISVRYEDILRNPATVMSKVLEMFGLDFEPKMLNFYKRNKARGVEPKETIAWKPKTLEPLSADCIDAYKNSLTLGEIEVFNRTAKKALNFFGYDA